MQFYLKNRGYTACLVFCFLLLFFIQKVYSLFCFFYPEGIGLLFIYVFFLSRRYRAFITFFFFYPEGIGHIQLYSLSTSLPITHSGQTKIGNNLITLAFLSYFKLNLSSTWPTSTCL